MRRVFITGSTDGLGRAAARQLIEEGHQVVLHARTAERAPRSGGPGATCRRGCHRRSRERRQTRALAEQVNKIGRMDAVIHNAGVYREGARGNTPEGHAKILAVNTLAPYLLTKLIERPDRLVYLSSSMHRGGDGSLRDIDWQERRWDANTAYSESKLYLTALAFSVARHWPKVLSNAVDPGWVPRGWAARARPMISRRDIARRPGWRPATMRPRKPAAGTGITARGRQAAAEAGDTEFQDRLDRQAGGAHRRQDLLTMNNEFDVVIVGGGAAGVGAARRLAGSGLSTLLLEADLRLGGRAWTREIAGLPLDLGCGWLHSAEKNALAALAEEGGIALDKRRAAWGTQFRDLGFSARRAGRCFPGIRRLDAPARGGAGRQRPRVRRARSAGRLEYPCPEHRQLHQRWPAGADVRGRLSQLRRSIDRHQLACGERTRRADRRQLSRIALRCGSRRRSIRSSCPRREPCSPPPPAWSGRAPPFSRSPRRCCPETASNYRPLWTPGATRRDRCRLGRNEKMFMEIVGEAPFENETQVLGNPRAPDTASYYIRPLGMPVVECFFGGEGARMVETADLAAAAAFALDQLAALFGESIRRSLRPRVISNWSRNTWVGGAYSYALPGQSGARQRLAQSFGQRVFFAGEATSRGEFSTAHGAYGSGVRAANEAVEALLPGRGRQAAGFTGGA